MRDRAYRPTRPQLLTIETMPAFAAFCAATMSPAAAQEPVRLMYSALGPHSTIERRHIEQQRDAAIGG
jgi:hypothetical protein